MTVSTLTQELEDAAPDELFDWMAFSTRLNEEFGAATTSEERGELLAARAVAMEFVVRQLQLRGEHLEKFNATKRNDAQSSSDGKWTKLKHWLHF
jgi:hypothetical protein